MAESVDQWMPVTAMPALCDVPLVELPLLPAHVAQLTPAQQPEAVTVDRYGTPDTASMVAALFS